MPGFFCLIPESRFPLHRDLHDWNLSLEFKILQINDSDIDEVNEAFRQLSYECCEDHCSCEYLPEVTPEFNFDKKKSNSLLRFSNQTASFINLMKKNIFLFGLIWERYSLRVRACITKKSMSHRCDTWNWKKLDIQVSHPFVIRAILKSLHSSSKYEKLSVELLFHNSKESNEMLTKSALLILKEAPEGVPNISISARLAYLDDPSVFFSFINWHENMESWLWIR